VTAASCLLWAIGADELLDAMPDSTAVLDSTGMIVAVNNAWRMFGRDNGGSPEGTGVGVNYLEVCARSAAAGCADAEEVGVALRAVLRGETVDSVLDYPCPSPAVGRWFALRATPIGGLTLCVLVSHTNITRQKVAERDLERQASHDPLTGLANRARFAQRLESALTPRHGRAPRAYVGLVYLDLDGFKPVNDTFGHAAGDEVLQNVAGRLAAVVRPQDTVARLGGDEFAVVAPRITAAGLAKLASRIDDALRQPHVVHGQAVTVAASVGACRAMPGEGAAEAVHRADNAMYVVKRARQAGGRRRETQHMTAPAESPTTS
jgi:diguanylate cyclase (GGDEF)-like protein